MPELVERPLLAPTGEAATGWPAEVRTELARRRELLQAAAERAGGRRLDLGDEAALALALDAGRGESVSCSAARQAPAERFDVVVSVAALVAVADLPLALRGVERLLDPDGRLLFVEPVSHPGWTGVLAASAGSLLAPLRGQHLGRDVPGAIRQAGLIITDMKRFTMPTTVWPLRSFVDGCGRPRVGFMAR